MVEIDILIHLKDILTATWIGNVERDIGQTWINGTSLDWASWLVWTMD